MMVNSLSILIKGINTFFNSIHETKEQKYRREMTMFLNQATDRLHLEYLESEWERLKGRLY
jgi:hypothetical protein